MKITKYLSILIFCFLITPGIAQNITTTTSFDVDGLKVIFKPSVKQVISVRMYYRGGVNNYKPQQAGIESLTLKALSQCGSQKYSNDDFKNKADQYDITLGASSNFDYGDVDMECVSKYFDQAWDLFAEAIAHPAFEDHEVALLKTKLISNLKQGQSNPDEHATQLLMRNAFEGTAYATDPNGDENTLTALNAADIKNYYGHLLNKERMFLVVAGNISKEDLIQKVKASFASLPSSPYASVGYQSPSWSDYRVTVENRELATNYIYAIMNTPDIHSPDFIPYEMGVAVLNSALFMQLRSQMNLSYAPQSYVTTAKMPYAIMSISTTQPRQAVNAMVDILNRVRSYGVSSSSVKKLKSGYLTNKYIKQQNSGSITAMLGSAEIMGSWEDAERMGDIINDVSAEQINAALNKYITGLRWSYLGDEKLAEDAASAFKKKVR